MLERITENIAPMLACAFFAVLFLQSGLDKVFDRAGNLSWMVPHFEKSPCRGKVPLFLTLLTVLEVLTGLANATALIMVAAGLSVEWAQLAIGLAGVTLLSLFAGQRLAKDYAGAASLAAYFAVALLGIFVSQ